jgi:phosphatidylserine/phosphatidylglycerophosphate/cardiolipin synthase-like enzyme
VEVTTLTDGGQPPEEVAGWIAAFIRPARARLEIALYDVRLPGPAGEAIAAELRAASGRGVKVRLIYNLECGRPAALHPPPSTRPDILEQLPIEARAISGIPDLMHHKYMVRDGEAVLTGSTNWTIDSWTREENVIATVEADAIAAAYVDNFEELWKRRDVEHSGFGKPRLLDADGTRIRAWFAPGHGHELSQRIATEIGCARRRVRIASPVITSGPVLSTLAELATRGAPDAAGAVDETQTDAVFHQWLEDGHSPWKIPLLAAVLQGLPFAGKPSTPWSADSVHDFMHAKVTVADDVVFLGSFNLSSSGEANAENVLEIHHPPLAERMAAFVDQVRSRYPASSVPAQAIAATSRGSSQISGMSKS